MSADRKSPLLLNFLQSVHLHQLKVAAQPMTYGNRNSRKNRSHLQLICMAQIVRWTVMMCTFMS